MSSENPFPDWVVGSLGSSQLSSLWPNGRMNNYLDPTQQLVVGLDVLSRTSRGRALYSRLADANITVPGANSLLEVAHGLEWNPRTEACPNPILERLARLTNGDGDTTLILLVALRQTLQEMAFAIGRLSSDPDVVSELLVGLLSEFAISGGVDSIEELLDRTYRSARRTMRRQDRQAAREVAWAIEDDPEEVIAADETSQILEGFVRSGIISSHDADVIRLTRIEGLSLAEVSKVRRAKYQAVKRRRNRAESAIRGFLRDAGEL
jgi:DNA-directed RNA polymerase specialized sigma24 family protein